MQEKKDLTWIALKEAGIPLFHRGVDTKIRFGETAIPSGAAFSGISIIK